MKTARPLRKYIIIFLIIVLLYAIFLFFARPEIKYTGRAPSPSGKNIASYSAEYIDSFAMCFSGTDVYIGKERIFMLDSPTSLLLDWIDDQHLNIVIPLTENAYFDDYNNDLSSWIQKYLPSYNGIKITINGKTFKARIPEYENAKCGVYLNPKTYGLFPIEE